MVYDDGSMCPWTEQSIDLPMDSSLMIEAGMGEEDVFEVWDVKRWIDEFLAAMKESGR